MEENSPNEEQVPFLSFEEALDALDKAIQEKADRTTLLDLFSSVADAINLKPAARHAGLRNVLVERQSQIKAVLKEAEEKDAA
jgi:hypothetical protein